MKYQETTVAGAFVVELEPVRDERGFFARTWDRQEFEARGLNPVLAHISISFNPRRGTLRGMHYQVAPYEEAKLVRCTRGRIYDVIVDLRRDSASFKRWFGVELSADNGRMIYIPEGVAHGFVTLDDDSEVLYHISQVYQPAAARGVRWDDPAFGIQWPRAVEVISQRDRTYEDFTC